MFKILEVSEYEIKAEALSLAIKYVDKSGFTPKETIEIAERFEVYLKGTNNEQ